MTDAVGGVNCIIHKEGKSYEKISAKILKGENMKRILVAYATHCGSPREVAVAVGDQLTGMGTPSEVAGIESVADLDRLSGVVIGAPRMFGWHPAAAKFVAKHLAALRRNPTAFFMTAMRLTRIDGKDAAGVPLFADPGLARPEIPIA
jgi:flavorubredoxin